MNYIQQSGTGFQDFGSVPLTEVNSEFKNSFPAKYKQLIVEEAKLHGISVACKKHGVSRNNVVRWLRNGVTRKEGSGRKTTNTEIEKKILNWIEDFIFKEKMLPKQKYILVKGADFVSENFKASKGWCDKFMKRNKVKINRMLQNSLKKHNKKKH